MLRVPEDTLLQQTNRAGMPPQRLAAATERRIAPLDERGGKNVMVTAETIDDNSLGSQRSGWSRLLPLPAKRALDDPTASFSDLLFGFRRRAQLSQSDLSRHAGVNASYINRLESGARSVPTAEVTLALAAGLALSPEETDRFLWSAGGLPPSLQQLAAGDPTILAVASLLNNRQLSPEAMADFRACVEAMAHRWRGGAR